MTKTSTPLSIDSLKLESTSPQEERRGGSSCATSNQDIYETQTGETSGRWNMRSTSFNLPLYSCHIHLTPRRSEMKNSLPDLQVGNITHTNILATVRLVAQFCVAVHKEYQCLRREVRSLRAESHSLAEKIAQQSCNATGDGPSIGTVVELPHRAVINRSDSEFSENNNSFDSGASGVNNSGGDETTCVDASESGAEMELPEDVHDNGASKSLSTDSNVHASTGDNDVSSEGTVCEMLDGKDTPKKSTGHNKVHAVSSGKRVKRRLLQDSDSDEENESTAKDGDVTISEVCQEISKTLEDDEQSNSSSFGNWSPVFELQKEAPQCVVSKAQRSSTERETGQAGSAPKSGRITKSKSGSKAVRSVAKSRNSQKSKSPYSDNMQRDSDDEYEATKRLKTAGSHRKPPRRQSTGQLTKIKAFLRIKIKAKKSTTRKCELKQTARSKDVNSRKRKSLPAGRIGINADADDTDQGDTDEEPSDTSPVVRRHSTDVHISNCRVVIEDDISPQTLAAAKKRCKLTEKQKAAHPGPRDLGDESNSNMVVELLDVGFLWQLSELLTQMLDEGQASLTFSAANITNYTRLNLAKNLCQRTSFKWDDNTKTIKRLRSSRHPGARDMEKVLRRIRPK